MISSPKITVIIPTYRRPHLLKRAIKSVLSQSYNEFRVCIYDNASQDETQSIVASIMNNDKRVLYHCHEKNIGALKNFQYGLKQVKTPFFSFLSDDDFLLPEFLETAMNGFDAYPEAAFSAASVITMTDKGKILYAPLSLWEKEGLFIPPEGLLETLGQKHPILPGILFRKEVISLTGGFDNEIGTGDLDFVFRIAAKSSFVISKKPVAVVVNHAQSSSVVASLSSYWPSWIKMINNITKDKDIPQFIKKHFQTALMEQIINELLSIGVRSFALRNFDQSEKIARILSDELNLCKKGQLLWWCARKARESRLFWRSVCIVIVIRREFSLRFSLKRIKLQKAYGHLTAGLTYD